MNQKLFAAVSLTLIVSGCATQAPTLDFIPEDVLPVENKVDAELKSITVSVAKEEERLGETQVGFFGNQYEASFKQSLKDALEEVLVKAAVFNDMSSTKISLTAKVMQFESPGNSVNFETKVIIRYEIFDRENGQSIFRRDISSTGSVPFDYAFVGAIRAAEARNRAMRENVYKFLVSLEDFEVPRE